MSQKLVRVCTFQDLVPYARALRWQYALRDLRAQVRMYDVYKLTPFFKHKSGLKLHHAAIMSCCEWDGARTELVILSLAEMQHGPGMQGSLPDTLLCIQHEPVYTIGKRGVADHFKTSQEKVRLNDCAAVQDTSDRT
jgi:hypothetical protein